MCHVLTIALLTVTSVIAMFCSAKSVMAMFCFAKLMRCVVGVTPSGQDLIRAARAKQWRVGGPTRLSLGATRGSEAQDGSAR